MFVVAVTYGCEYPCDVHESTTAGEKEVIVELVLLGRGSLESRALDGQYDGRIIRRHKYMPSEAILIILPAKRKTLPNVLVPQSCVPSAI